MLPIGNNQSRKSNGVSPYIKSLPKAELHLHLEGAIEPETLMELARNHGLELDPVQVEQMYQYNDFSGFLLSFRAITEHLQTPEDYELITYRMMERLHAENVLHAEVFISVGTCIWWGRDFAEIFEGIERGRIRGERDFGVSVYWIADAVRHFGPEAAQCVVDRVNKLQSRNVVGFGIGGDERRAAPELFREVYLSAKKYGLRLTAHAGESVGPESVWGAINALRAERIGHGLNSWQDRELLARLVEAQIPVEISVSSNIRTGCCKSLEHHPLRTYYNLGLMITLNTDDPAMFGTTIGGEYQIAQDSFGFTDAQLKTLAMNSFKASFLPDERKREFLRLFEALPAAHGN